MLNENKNKEIFILKYPKSLTTKSVLESEFFSIIGKTSYSVALDQQFTEIFVLNRAAEHKVHRFKIFWPPCLQSVEKRKSLFELTKLCEWVNAKLCL